MIAILGGAALLVATPVDWPMMGSRSTGLRDSLAILNSGGPSLLGRHHGVLYPVGATDDLGIFVYLPWLSHVLGVHDPVSLVRYGFVISFAVSAGTYPVLFWRLTGSILASVVAPVLMLMVVVSLGFNDIYWVSAWASLALLPPLLVLANERIRLAGGLLVAIAFGAGWLDTMRSASGLGVAFAALIVLLLQRFQWWKTVLTAALMALAFVSIGSFMIPAVIEHRDDRVRVPLSTAQGHPFWHPMYLGLGYLPNNYGIRFLDSIAIATVHRDSPTAAYLSSQYEATLRRAYFRIVRKHPLEVLKQYAAKAWVTLADTLPYLLLIALSLPRLMLLKARRIRRWLWLIAPSFVVMFAPTLVAIPLQVYEEGLYGAVGLVAIIGVCLNLADLGQLAPRARSLRECLGLLAGGTATYRGRPARVSRVGAVTAVAILALLPLVISAHFIRRDAEAWQHASSGVLFDDGAVSPVAAR